MNLLQTEIIDIERPGEPTIVNYESVNGASTFFTDIPCNIQALGGDEILLLPEADRNKEPIVIHSVFEIKIKDKITNAEGDVFQVHRVEDYKRYGLPIDHYVTVATKIVEAL